MRTVTRIFELANQEGVQTETVVDWLGTLAGSTRTEEEAIRNLVYDAKVFTFLNILTLRVIQQGIREHFHGR